MQSRSYAMRLLRGVRLPMPRETIRMLRRGECTSCVLATVIILISTGYWIIAHYVDAYLLNDLVDGPLMTVSFAAGMYYLSWSMMNCHKLLDRPFMLRFGICLTWLGNFVWRVSRFMYAQGLLPGPIGAHDNWRGYMILLMAIG